jgi:hypothetical protein
MATAHSLSINERQILAESLMPNAFRVGWGNRILLGLCAVLVALYASVLLTYAITGHIVNIGNLAVFTITDFFFGPIFIGALGAYLFRHRKRCYRFLAGVCTFLLFYGLESAIAYHHGVLGQYGIYPRGIYFAELLFFPAYMVVMFTVSASFLYNRIDDERWKTIGAPMVCAVLVGTNLIPINFVDTELLLYGLSFLSFFSLLGLPQMHRRLVHSLGEAGHQLFSILLLGYIATMALAAQIQLIELVSEDIFTYTTLLGSTPQTHSMDHPTVLAVLFSANWLGKLGLIGAAVYLGFQMREGGLSFVKGCETICKNSIQYILPGALAIILVTFIFEPWEEIYVQYSGKDDAFDTASTPDLIQFFTAPGGYELVITVCGPEEHLTNYERRDTGHKVFGILSEPGDNFSIERTKLSSLPNVPYANSIQGTVECSELHLQPTPAWTDSDGNAIDLTNASVMLVHIDSGKASNVGVYPDYDEADHQQGAYSLCLWLVLLPVLFVYFRRIRKQQARVMLEPQS